MSKHPLSFDPMVEEVTSEPALKKVKTIKEKDDVGSRNLQEEEASNLMASLSGGARLRSIRSPVLRQLSPYQSSAEDELSPPSAPSSSTSPSLTGSPGLPSLPSSSSSSSSSSPLPLSTPSTTKAGLSSAATLSRLQSIGRTPEPPKKLSFKSKDLVDDSDALGEIRERRPLADEEEEFENDRRRRYRTLSRESKEKLEEISAMISSEEEIDKKHMSSLVDGCQYLRRVLEAKYNREKKIKPRKIAFKPKDHPSTAEELNDLIRGDEELERPWIVSANTQIPASGLLMRVTDESSMAKLHPHVGFLSHGSEGLYNTKEWRKFELGEHANWSNKTPTTFISTTSCPTAFRDTWIKRFLRRDENKPSRNTVKLTFINAIARHAAGWPSLCMLDEILYYNVRTPAGLPLRLYKNEYVLPMRVDPDQIVGTWCWTEVEKWMREHNSNFDGFFQRVAIPAFQEHESARKEGRAVTERVGCVCCGHGTKI